MLKKRPFILSANVNLLRKRNIGFTRELSSASNLNSYTLVKHESRSVIALRGLDAPKLLQGLTTNDVMKLRNKGDAQFTAFLNPKGRCLYEAIVSVPIESSPESPLLLLDCDSNLVDGLLSHLRKHKLRSRTEIVDFREQYTVFNFLPLQPFSLLSSGPLYTSELDNTTKTLSHDVEKLGGVVFRDPRCFSLGYRVLLPSSSSLQEQRASAATPLDYHALRVLLGVPEGKEVQDVVPLEWSLTFLNGVSFDKGCYVGQELIARTHFRGFVRKRFVPVFFSPGGVAARPVCNADPIAVVSHPASSPASSTRHHGSSHGPSQVHDFPATQASGHTQHHSRIHASVPPSEGAASERRIQLPFPFLDQTWRGSVPPGSSVYSDSSVDHGASRGKIIASVPGLNMGFALIRLEHLVHTLPLHPRFDVKDTRSDQDEGALDARAIEVGEDFSDPKVIAKYKSLHEKCSSVPVHFKVDTPENSYRVTPILPIWWKNINHAGVENADGE
jgi:folate-binding protein YgfZ